MEVQVALHDIIGCQSSQVCSGNTYSQFYANLNSISSVLLCLNYCSQSCLMLNCCFRCHL